MLNAIVFVVLGFLVLVGAASCVTSNNIVHGAFWLLLCAVASAGMIWYLGAEYIAITQLMVYAGAVSILTIFTVMVTQRSYEDTSREAKLSWSALILAVGFFALLAYGILSTPEFATYTEALPSYDLPTFGALMFAPEGHVLAFELASMVLIVALIAAVWWTKDTDDEIEAEAASAVATDTRGLDALPMSEGEIEAGVDEAQTAEVTEIQEGSGS